MISGAIEAGAALILGICGGVYIIGQIKESSKKNEEDINIIKTMMDEFQDKVIGLLAKSMDDVKKLIDKEKDNNRENLGREISHIKDLLNMTSNETREDIKRLESAQRESNRIKERLAIAENSIRSLHHRMDVDPSPLIKKDDD